MTKFFNTVPFGRRAFGKAFGSAFGKAFGLQDAGFLPTDISDLGAWYDGSDLTTLTETGGLVTTMADKSGGGFDIVAMAGDEPTTGTNTWSNGRNVLFFDGSADYMEVSSFPMATTSTTFIVCKPISPIGASAAVYSFDAAGDYQVDPGTANQFHTNLRSTALGLSPPVLDPTDRVDTEIIIGLKWSTSDVEVGINGTVVASDANYNNTMDPSMILRIGSNRNVNAMAHMEFGEFVHYNKELDGTELNTVEDYLAAKWGL